MDSNNALATGEGWREYNSAGLVLSSQQRWPEAIVAFEGAIALLELRHDQDAADNEVLELQAQVCANLAQAHFRAGYVAEAIPYAERSCAIRVALWGEQALSVARARADFAVVLGADGQVDSAIALLDKAIAAVSAKGGGNSELLVPLLDNAARLLLSNGRGEAALPYANRMLLLLHSSKQKTSPAEYLIATIMAGTAPIEVAISAVPEYTFVHADPLSLADDYMLRQAVAETGQLLRSTPPSNKALPDSAAVMDSLPDFPSRYADTVKGFPDIAVPTEPEKPFDGAAFDLVEAPPPTLDIFPDKSQAESQKNSFGFEVQHGLTPETADHEALEQRPPIARVVHITEKVPVVLPGMRAAGRTRHGRTRVLEPKRIWYVVIAAIVFIAAIGLTVFLLR